MLDVDWGDFRILLAIARERTLSAAARRLHVDQSTISRRLVAVEAATQTRLFSRTPDGYVLTAAGEAALADLEQIERSAAAVERTLLGQDARLEGSVRLAISDSFAAWFLVPRMHRLRAQQPGIVVELVTGNAPVNLARREADLSLRMSKPAQPNLIARRIGRAAWAVYGADTYLSALGVPDLRRSLEGHSVVAFEDALQGTIGAKWMREHASRAQVALVSNSMLVHAAAVVEGVGVSPLPCVFADNQPALRRLGSDTIGGHDVWLVVHPDVKTSARVRAVMDFLAQELSDASALLAGESARSTSVQQKRRKAQRRSRVK